MLFHIHGRRKHLDFACWGSASVSVTSGWLVQHLWMQGILLLQLLLMCYFSICRATRCVFLPFRPLIKPVWGCFSAHDRFIAGCSLVDVVECRDGGGGGKTECGQTDSRLLYQDWRSFQSGSKARCDVKPRNRAEHTNIHIVCLVWSIRSFSWSHGWLPIDLRLCRSLMSIRDLCRARTVYWKQKQTVVRRFLTLCTRNDFLMGLLILLWFKPQNNRTWRTSSQEAVSAVRPHRHVWNTSG